MLDVFGDHGNGVRLKLRLTPEYADLRGIHVQAGIENAAQRDQ